MPLEEGRMHRFVADLMAEDGGLVEPLEPDGLEVLAPLPLQQALARQPRADRHQDQAGRSRILAGADRGLC